MDLSSLLAINILSIFAFISHLLFLRTMRHECTFHSAILMSDFVRVTSPLCTPQNGSLDRETNERPWTIMTRTVRGEREGKREGG